MKRSNYQITHINDVFVFIIDLNGQRSVTNDAENVVSELHKRYPGKRIVYRDSMNQWDEMKHDNNGNFVDFIVYKGYVPTV